MRYQTTKESFKFKARLIAGSIFSLSLLANIACQAPGDSSGLLNQDSRSLNPKVKILVNEAEMTKFPSENTDTVLFNKIKSDIGKVLQEGFATKRFENILGSDFDAKLVEVFVDRSNSENYDNSGTGNTSSVSITGTVERYGVIFNFHVKKGESASIFTGSLSNLVLNKEIIANSDVKITLENTLIGKLAEALPDSVKNFFQKRFTNANLDGKTSKTETNNLFDSMTEEKNGVSNFQVLLLERVMQPLCVEMLSLEECATSESYKR